MKWTKFHRSDFPPTLKLNVGKKVGFPRNRFSLTMQRNIWLCVHSSVRIRCMYEGQNHPSYFQTRWSFQRGRWPVRAALKGLLVALMFHIELRSPLVWRNIRGILWRSSTSTLHDKKQSLSSSPAIFCHLSILLQVRERRETLTTPTNCCLVVFRPVVTVTSATSISKWRCFEVKEVILFSAALVCSCQKINRKWQNSSYLKSIVTIQLYENKDVDNRNKHFILQLQCIRKHF